MLALANKKRIGAVLQMPGRQRKEPHAAEPICRFSRTRNAANADDARFWRRQRLPGARPDWGNHHGGAALSGARGGVRRVPFLDSRRSRRCLQGEGRAPALLASGGGRASGTRRQKRRHRDADRVGQDALLQPAGAERDSGKYRHTRDLSFSDEGARAGSTHRTARSEWAARRIDSAFSRMTATRRATRARRFAKRDIWF